MGAELYPPLQGPPGTSATTVNTAFQSPLETAFVVTSQITSASTQNLYVTTNGSLVLYNNASGPAGNWTFNVASTAGVSLNTLLSIGQSVTIAVFVYQASGTTAYCTGIAIDGTTLVSNTNLFWQGGVAPTVGNASGYDAYTITITKTASATYTTFASLVRF